MIWPLAILLAALSIGAVLWPLLRPKADAQARAEFDKEIYRDQLAEIDRDMARGSIGETEAKAARAEIGRRLLSVAGEAAEASVARPALRKFAVLLVLALPVAGVALYADRGAPDLPGQPIAERRLQGPDGGDTDRQQIVRFAQTMRERAAKDPNDLEAWVRLAQATSALGQSAEALTAWRKADEIAGKPPEIAGLLGEAAVAANDGNVTPEAEAAFARVLEAAPGDPRARYFLGLTRLQSGQARQAVQIWFDLIAASPKDAPWVASVRARMEDAAKESRINLRGLRASAKNPPAQITLGPPSIVPPGAAPGIAGLPDAERLAAIRTMVESLATRLEAQPDDLDGWRRLARSWRVLGERDKALAAFARTAAIVPNNVDVLHDYADALLDMVPETERLPAPGREAMARLLELEPANPAALWLNGLDAANAGNKLAATALWQRLLDTIPADSPARADLAARIEKLKRAE